MRKTTSMVLLAAAVLIRWQEPQDPKKPVSTPATTRAAKSDVPGKPERHRFEGVYKLQKRVVVGQADTNPSTGYLAITGRHLFLHLAAPGSRPEYPLLNSGVREWREVKNTVRTVVKLDYFTDGGGGIHTVAPGKEEIRRIEPIRGGVRVYQGDHTWLEFERIE